MKAGWYHILLMVMMVITGQLSGIAQDSAAHAKLKDSVRPGFVERMQQFARDTRKNALEERDADKAAILQDELVENVKKTAQHARAYLKNGIDTIGISEDLVHINQWHGVAGDGVFTRKGSVQTFRNLTTTYNLLRVLESRLLDHKNKLDYFQHRLSMFRFQLDSLSSDSAMFQFSADSLTLLKYLQKLVSVAYEIGPVDSILKKAIIDVRTLQTKVNTQVYKIAASKDEIELYQREIYRNTFRQEVPGIWNPVIYDRPFREVIHTSLLKGWLTFRFYIDNNKGKLGLLLLLYVLSVVYLRSLKKIYQTQNRLDGQYNGQLILRYPFFSSIVVVCNLFQFLFAAPPFLFSALLWSLAVIALTVLFTGFISRYWMRFWLINSALFFIVCFDNALLQASRPERWVMLVLAAIGAVFNVVSVRKGNTKELKEGWIVFAIYFMVVLELASIVANCLGYYNLGKGLFISGYFSLIIAILFLWTVRLINEALYLAFVIYAGQDKRLFYLNFQRVGNKAPALLYYAMFAGWFVLVGRNFYAFQLMAAPVKAFLSEERRVGDYTFSVNTLFLFIFITGLSIVISRIVSYFASDKHVTTNAGAASKEPRVGLGSWLLLIRIAIIGLGLFLAFAAAGIPMDKITLVLGALGVGIGFGLQTLVNNLVSGLIIAFEKPVNVGDVVEIDNQAGTMKSIGFRSSVISTWDGADMVMPNGDLLNSHLVNWTLGGNKRRMSLTVGLAYDTDLQKARDLLTATITADERVLKYPAPSVQFQEFGKNSIEVKLLFWVHTYKDGFSVRSELVIAIQQAFKEQGIVIPFTK